MISKKQLSEKKLEFLSSAVITYKQFVTHGAMNCRKAQNLFFEMIETVFGEEQSKELRELFFRDFKKK